VRIEMDEIIKGFYDYGIYIISSLVILSAILAIIVSSAKECPYPAECFDCSDTSCSECYHLSMYKKHKQAKPAPSALHPGYGLQLHQSEKNIRTEEHEAA
jgi:hypothetical protein